MRQALQRRAQFMMTSVLPRAELRKTPGHLARSTRMFSSSRDVERTATAPPELV